jgi:transposase-like protein
MGLWERVQPFAALFRKPMPGAAKIQLTVEQQDELENCVRSRTLAVRTVERARIILDSAAGNATKEIADQVGVVRQTVARWVRRFQKRGDRGAGGRAAVGKAPRHPTREDPADRPQNNQRNASQLHPLEHAKLG